VAQLKRSNSEASDLQTRELKKLKTTDHKVFKRKGNEIQYKFNAKLEDIINEANDSIQAKAVEKARHSLEEGIALIQDRQKLILLADKSDYGWKTAAEYEQHELATDEVDAKRIRRAEERAEKASKAEITKKKLLKPKSQRKRLRNRLSQGSIFREPPNLVLRASNSSNRLRPVLLNSLLRQENQAVVLPVA
jgi:hypothetical protein